MRLGEVRHLDVVAQARPVRGRVVGPEDVEPGALSERRLGGHLDEVCGIRRRLAGPPLRIRAGDVEVAQDHVGEAVRRGGVGDHPLAHQLRAAVGVDRPERQVLGNRRDVGLAVDGRGRGEDHVLDAGAYRGLDQRAGLHRVGQVVAQGIGYGIGHDDLGGEMGQGVDAVLEDRLRHEGLVGHVADDELHALRDRPVETGGQIVQDDDLLMAGVEERQHHVAADVAGTTRHQNRHLTPSAPTPAPAYAFADGKFTPRHLILSTYMLATARVKLSH